MTDDRAAGPAPAGEYAEVIDLGVQWDGGAPLPHVVSDANRCVLVCRAVDDGPAPVSPRDESTFAVIEFSGCTAIRFGAPNDEALPGHPLYGKGLAELTGR